MLLLIPLSALQELVDFGIVIRDGYTCLPEIFLQ